MVAQEFKYTSDDQEFFFEISTQILDRFKVLDGVPERYLDNIVLHFSDELVNILDDFRKIKQ